MPPKQRITREMILESAFVMFCNEGMEVVNARSVAKALNCSTQPIFSNFENMEQLKLAVVGEAYRMYWQLVEQVTEEGKYPTYKSSGMAYIRFAQQEKELFKLLYMRDRSGEHDVADTKADELVQHQLQSAMGMSEETAHRFHLEMWAVVHGFASMAATGFMPLNEELISSCITDVYQGLCAHSQA